MKKILSISVIAALAVLPMAANATPTYGTVPAEPVDATANTNVASTSFVRGAYNAAIAVANKENQRALAAEGDLTTLTTTDKSSLVNAINELTDSANIDYDNTTSGLTATDVQAAIDEIAGTAGTALQGVQVNGSDLSVTNGKVNVTVAEGATNGTVAVNGSDVAVHGLGSSAFVNTGDLADTANTYDNTTSHLTATTIQDAIDEVAGTAGNAADKDLSNLSSTGTGVITTAITNNAAGATYSNTSSGLTATTLQDAIDELSDAIDDQGDKVLKVYTTWNTDVYGEVSLGDSDPYVANP